MTLSTPTDALEATANAASSDHEIVGDPMDFGSGARGWLRAGTSFLAVLTLVMLGIQYIYSMYRPDLNDPDIWWHMRNAQYLFQHHQFPRFDMFSFTVAGHPWINHEWLSEVPYYLAYRTFGLVGLKSLTFFVLDTIFLLLLYLSYQESRNFKASFAACCYSTFLATVSFGPRTILFGYVYMVILLIILQRFRQRGNAPLWVIPVLFCLWANTHGSWSLGLILFFLIGASGLVGGSWGRVDSVRWTPTQLRKLILTGIASIGGLFVNPFGWRLVYYPFDLAFKQKLNISHVAEWVSVDFHDVRGKMVLVLLLGLLISALVRNRRWNLGEILVLLFGIYSGLTYIRFLVLLGIAVAPVTHWKYYDTIYTERYNGLRQDNAAGYDKGSPLTYAKNLRGRLLIVHGSGDDNVHFENTLAMVNAFVDANRPFSLMVYPNRNHGIYGGNTRQHLYTLLTKFVEDNLPAATATGGTRAALP